MEDLRLHFANSGTVRVPAPLLLKRGGFRMLDLKVRYGIVEHPRHGLIVIDGGYAPSSFSRPHMSRMLKAYRQVLRPRISALGGPHAAFEKIGRRVEEVQHIILTHLHLDHIGYLEQFPGAKIHLSRAALEELETTPARRLARHGIFKEAFSVTLRPRAFFFDEAPLADLPEGLEGLGRDILADGSIIAVPLPGHATGHHGLLFPTMSHPVLYAADAAWTLPGLLEGRERRLPVIAVSRAPRQALATARMLRSFSAKSNAEILLCHDPSRTPYDLPMPVGDEA